MTKITITEDCGNSPHQTFLKAFNTALARGDTDFIFAHVSEDFVWWIDRDKKLEGKESFSKEIHSMMENVADKMILHNIINHGRTASANGEIKMAGKVYAFCTSVKGSLLKEIQSYIV